MILCNTPLGDLKVSRHIIERNDQRLGLQLEDFLQSVIDSRPATRKEIEFYLFHKIIGARNVEEFCNTAKLLCYKEYLYLVRGNSLVTIFLVPGYLAKLGKTRRTHGNDKDRTSERRQPYKREKSRRKLWL